MTEASAPPRGDARAPSSRRARLAEGVALLGVAVAVVVLQLGPQLRDGEPTHFDEWRSVAWARRAIDSGRLSAQPVVGSPDGLARDIADRNRSLAFVALVAGWIRLSGHPTAHYKGLAVLFLLIYVVGLHVLARSLRAPPVGGLAAGLFAATLPTHLMILGPRLGVPSSASLGVLCLALAAHQHLRRSQGPIGAAASQRRARSWAALLVVCAGLLALLYPLSLIVFAAVVGFDVFSSRTRRATRYARWLAISGAVFALALLAYEWRSRGASFAEHVLGLLLVDERWHLLRVVSLPIATLVPVALLVLGVPAALYCLTRDRLRWVALLVLGPLASHAAYEWVGASLVVPYQRLGLYLGLGCCACAGLGVGWLFEWLRRRGVAATLAWCVAGGVAAGVLALPRPHHELETLHRLHRPSPQLRAALAWIAANHRPPATVLAPPAWSKFVEPLTGLRAAPEGLDAALTGRPLSVGCDDRWTLIIGPTDCPGYALAGRWGDVPVYERRGAQPRPPAPGPGDGR